MEVCADFVSWVVRNPEHERDNIALEVSICHSGMSTPNRSIIGLWFRPGPLRA